MQLRLTLQEIFFLGLLAFISYTFYQTIAPFVIDIIFALVLTIVFRKPFVFFSNRFKKSRTLPATFTLILVILLLVLPVVFFAIIISREISSNYALFVASAPQLQQYFDPEVIRQYIENLPVVGDSIKDIDWTQYKDKAMQYITQASSQLLQVIQNTFMNLSAILVDFFIILFLMYYMLVDGDKLRERLHYLIPLPDEQEHELADSIQRTADAIVINTLFIAVVEGTYCALLLWIVGVPSPFFWGMIIVLLSILPVLGSNMVLVPVAIIEFLMGNYAKGIIVLVFGVGAVLINQNIVKPRLDGKRSGMHPALAFMSTIGGLMWLGIPGFIIGPLITGLFLVIWQQYALRYKQHLEHFNK